ncbi:hypothetical protein FRC00_011816 [Tulasnella sp. 408]|nr:hypothetical protein FRC00_011816 [Tulasnella sp. 408]
MTHQAPVTVTSSAGIPPQSRSFLELPTEVLGLIVDALAQHDRTSLVRTCRYMQKLVEPLLYRHLCTVKGPRRPSFDDEKLFITLTERPELIQHARSYKGRLTPCYLGKGQQQRLQCLGTPGLKRLLMVAERIEISTTIFTRAINIRDIHIARDVTWHPEDSLEPIWQSLLDKKLERLSIDYFDHPTPIPALLRAQIWLKKLAIFSNVTGWEDLDGAHLPLLEHLTCTVVQAASIVPGRPVGRLRLREANEDESVLGEEFFQQLARSTGPIVEFIMRFPFKATPGIFQRTLQFISCYLSHIESLTIIVNGFISGEVVGRFNNGFIGSEVSDTLPLPFLSAPWRNSFIQISQAASPTGDGAMGDKDEGGDSGGYRA